MKLKKSIFICSLILFYSFSSFGGLADIVSCKVKLESTSNQLDPVITELKADKGVGTQSIGNFTLKLSFKEEFTLEVLSTDTGDFLFSTKFKGFTGLTVLRLPGEQPEYIRFLCLADPHWDSVEF